MSLLSLVAGRFPGLASTERYWRGGTVQLRPVPALVVQDAIHAAEGITACLVAGLTEDASGASFHYVPVILTSLLALQFAVADYNDMIRRSDGLPGGVPQNKFKVVAVGNHELRELEDALTRCIEDVVKAYRDALSIFSFPDMYSRELELTLRKIEGASS